MSSCPNCGKEIIQGASFCPYCQTQIREKIERKIREKDIPRIIAICTFFYSFFMAFVYAFFLRQLDKTDLRMLLLGIELLMPFLILYTIIKKPKIFRFLSLLINLAVIIRYAIWENNIGFYPITVL